MLNDLGIINDALRDMRKRHAELGKMSHQDKLEFIKLIREIEGNLDSLDRAFYDYL